MRTPLVSWADAIREKPMLPPEHVPLIAPHACRAYYLEIVAGRDGWRCFYCGEYPEAVQLDHVRPKSRGGSDAPANLVIACESCNRAKGTTPGWAFVVCRMLPLEPTKFGHFRLIPKRCPNRERVAA